MNRALAMLLIGLIFGGGIGFTIAAGAGVTLDGHDHSAHLAGEDGAVDHGAMDHAAMGHDMGADAHDHDSVITLDAGPDAPTLDIDVTKDGAGWNLRVITTNFTLTPERIGGEWWRPDASPDRDYWRAEDETGARWLVFRETAADGADAWRRHGALG